MHASQQNVVTLQFGSPCSPRSALFAHDLNRHGLQRVAPFDHEVFRLQTLNLMLSRQDRVWQPSGTFSVFVSTTGCSVRSCVISTLRLLRSSDERVWVLLVSTTGCPVLSEETASS